MSLFPGGGGSVQVFQNIFIYNYKVLVDPEGIDQDLLDKHKAALAKEEADRLFQKQPAEQVRATIAERKDLQNQISEQREKKRRQAEPEAEQGNEPVAGPANVARDVDGNPILV